MRLYPFLLTLVTLAAGCRSQANADNEYSQGQIVSHNVNEVWLATHSALRGLGRGSKHFDETGLKAQAIIQGQAVTVSIEKAGQGKTIVRVMTPDPTIATDVLQSISALLRRP